MSATFCVNKRPDPHGHEFFLVHIEKEYGLHNARNHGSQPTGRGGTGRGGAGRGGAGRASELYSII